MKTISFTPKQLQDCLGKLEKPLRRYLEIQELAAVMDEEFRKKFCVYYRVRRNAGWRNAYFGLMRDMRDRSADFRSCLIELYHLTGRMEASFASKLVATIDPRLPVIDSVVLRNLSLRLPSPKDPDRLEKICEVHRALGQAFAAFSQSPSGRDAIAAFRAAYPVDGVTDTKIVDLLLWQTRPVAHEEPQEKLIA